MFNLSGSEIVFILLLALVILGPEKLPEALRSFGRTYGELKKMSSGFQSEFKQAIDEPMRELRGTADALRRASTFDAAADLLEGRPAGTAPEAARAAASDPFAGQAGPADAPAEPADGTASDASAGAPASAPAAATDASPADPPAAADPRLDTVGADPVPAPIEPTAASAGPDLHALGDAHEPGTRPR